MTYLELLATLDAANAGLCSRTTHSSLGARNVKRKHDTTITTTSNTAPERNSDTNKPFGTQVSMIVALYGPVKNLMAPPPANPVLITDINGGR